MPPTASVAIAARKKDTVCSPRSASTFLPADECATDYKALHFISDFKGATQQKGITQLPKRTCNSSKTEIARFCKLTSSGTVEPLAFKVGMEQMS